MPPFAEILRQSLTAQTEVISRIPGPFRLLLCKGLLKVYCDERLPRCSACQKRDTSCIRSGQNVPTSCIPSTAAEIPSPSKHEFDLQGFQLFYHFEHVTLSTLGIGNDGLWRNTIRLAMENRPLMHSILSMAAAHINFEHPGNTSIVEAELYHQSAAVSGLREALDTEITSSNSDVIFACSILLYHHAWTRTDDEESSLAVEFPTGLRDLIPLGSGMRGIVMETVLTRTGIWQETMAYSPRVALSMCTTGTRFPDEVEARLVRQYCLVCPQDPEKKSWRFEAYIAEARRLVPVVSVIRMNEEGSNITMPTKSVTRYLFTWPVLLGEGFFELVRRKDFLGPLILLHFFQAVVRADIENMWWSKKRTNFILGKIMKSFEETDIKVVNLYLEEGEESGPTYLDPSDPRSIRPFRGAITKEMQDSAPMNLGG